MKSFSILGGKAMVVEMPDGAKKTDIISRWLEVHRHVDGYGFTTDLIDLPLGTWQIVGMLPEVKEEHVTGIVDYVGTRGDIVTMDSYRNYDLDGDDLATRTAIESLESAIRAEGYYLDKTPLPDPEETMRQGNGFVYYGADDEDFVKYEEAQSRVLCRERTLILRRVDGE